MLAQIGKVHSSCL